MDNPEIRCTCGGELLVESNMPLWQGPHIGAEVYCKQCSKQYIADMPTGQGRTTPFLLDRQSKKVVGATGKHWFAKLMYSFVSPNIAEVKFTIENRAEATDVIILNTLDFCYGHSFLFLLNIENILEKLEGKKLVVIVQPMLLWLIPGNEKIAEVWTVHLPFSKVYDYYPKLSDRINKEVMRFQNAYISTAHLLPAITSIEKFTKVTPFQFSNPTSRPRITFIWRQDAGRLWIKNRYINFIFRKTGLSVIALQIQQLRIIRLFNTLKKSLGKNYCFTIAGLGKKNRFPAYICDERITDFSTESERRLCEVYAESILVIGVHGSSMLLPSAHAGMAISIMPAKRWGNYLEDLLLTENDKRLAAFQKRVLPMRMPLQELADICMDMVTGRQMFVKKFIYNDKEL